MTAFINHTLVDLRGGRSSWRVLLTVTLPSFAIAFATALIHLSH
jgi:hypothetical protein